MVERSLKKFLLAVAAAAEPAKGDQEDRQLCFGAEYAELIAKSAHKRLMSTHGPTNGSAFYIELDGASHGLELTPRGQKAVSLARA